MTFSKAISKQTFVLGMLSIALGGANVFANLAFPVIQDINASNGLAFNQTDVYNNSDKFSWDEEAVYKGNDILVATLVDGTLTNGIGISLPISNGENGLTSSDGGNNVDIDNLEPVNAAIAAANDGGRLSNGNVIRASVWMKSDPNDPATGVGGPGAASMPQVEGILKIELWKEALSNFGDFDGPGDSDYGDRIWDQDQQGAGGSFVDINADGFSGGFGAPVTVTLSSENWTQMVVEYVVDDNPADPGNTFAPWFIGFDQFDVSHVEDVRAAFFAGDWTGTNFAGGGSWWMDNFAIEVFADQSAADAVDPETSNPAPIEIDGIEGDYDESLLVSQGDLDIVLLNWGSDSFPGNEANLPGGGPFDGLVSQNELDGVLLNWGNGAAAIASVPEPSTCALLVLSLACLTTRGRKQR